MKAVIYARCSSDSRREESIEMRLLCVVVLCLTMLCSCGVQSPQQSEETVQEAVEQPAAFNVYDLPLEADGYRLSQLGGTEGNK